MRCACQIIAAKLPRVMIRVQRNGESGPSGDKIVEKMNSAGWINKIHRPAVVDISIVPDMNIAAFLINRSGPQF